MAQLGLSRWRSWLSVAVAAVVVIVTVVVVAVSGPSYPVLSASTGPVKVGFGRVDDATLDHIVPLASDGLSVVVVTVQNTGSDSEIAGELVVDVDFPAGVSFVEQFGTGADDDAADTGETNPSLWSCTGADMPSVDGDGRADGVVDVVCRAEQGTDDASSALLPAGGALSVMLLVETDGAVSNEVVRARATVPGVEAEAFAEARTVDVGRGVPLMLPLSAGDLYVGEGESGSTVITVRNAGTGESVVDDGVATVLREVLPEGVVSSWSVADDVWTCEGPDSGPVDCMTGIEVGVGEQLPELELEWVVSDAFGLQPDDEVAIVEWEMVTNGNGHRGESESFTDPRVLIIAPPRAPSLHVRTSATASSHVMPGQQVAFDVTVAVGEGDADDVSLRVDAPEGLSVVELESASCDTTSQPAVCSLGRLASGTEETLALTMAAGDDAPEGPQTVTVSLSAPYGETSSDTHQLIVSDGARPSIGGRVVELGVDGHVNILDGRDIVTNEDYPARFGVRVRNVGPLPIAAGTTALVSWSQAAGSGVASLVAPNDGTCTSDEDSPLEWTCSFDLPSTLAPGDDGPVVDITVSDNAPADDIDLGTFRFDIDVDGHVPHELSVRLDVEENASHLRPRLAVTSPLTSGGTGTVEVHLETLGARTEATPTLTVVFPDGMVARPEPDSNCTAVAERLVCTFDRIAPASTSEVRSIAVDVGTAAGSHQVTLLAEDLRANGSVADRTRHTSDMVIVVAEELSASVRAWPPVVVPSPDGEGTTVALAATAQSHDAHVGAQSEWRQRCITSADVDVVPGCDAVTPEVEFIDHAGSSTRRVVIPDPTEPITYVFEYALSDGSDAHSEFVSVQAFAGVDDTVAVSELTAHDLTERDVSEDRSRDLSSNSVFLPKPTAGELPLELGAGFTLTSLTSGCYGSTVGTVTHGSAVIPVVLQDLSYPDGAWELQFYDECSSQTASGSVVLASGLSLPAEGLAKCLGSLKYDGSIRFSYDPEVNGYCYQAAPALSSFSIPIADLAPSTVYGSGTCSAFGSCDITWTANVSVTSMTDVGDIASKFESNGVVSAVFTESPDQQELALMLNGSKSGGSLSIGPVTVTPTFSWSTSSDFGDLGVTRSAGATNGWYATLRGLASYPGSSWYSDVVADYRDGGWIMALDLRNSTNTGMYFADGASLGAVIVVNDTNQEQSITVSGTAYSTPASSQVVVGDLTVPSWFRQLTGSSSSTVAVHTVSAPGSTDLSLEIAGNFAIDLPGDVVTIDFTQFVLELKYGSQYGGSRSWYFGIAGEARVSTSGEFASSMMVDVDLSTGYGWLHGSFTATDGSGWRDAFGISGLNLTDLKMSIDYQYGQSTTIDLALHASAELPSSLNSALAVQPGTVATATVALTDEKPCLSIGISNPNGGTALSMAGGVLTTNVLSVVAAPAGCTLGSTVIPQGYTLSFDGAFFGTTVKIDAQMAPETLAIDTSVSLGRFDIGGLQVDNSALVFKRSGSSSEVGLSGDFALNDRTYTVSGDFSRSGETTTMTGSVAIPSMDLDLVRLSDVVLSVTATSTNSSDSSSGEVRFSGAGVIDLLGADIDVNQFDIDVKNGHIERVSASVDATVPVDGITFSGRFTGVYDKVDSSQNSLTAQVSATTNGFTFASGTLDLAQYSASFVADFDFGSMFSAQVSGTVVSKRAQGYVPIANESGQTVSAQPGDFRFEVDNLSMRIGSFEADGSFRIGRVDGNFFAAADATLRLGIGHEQASVTVSGDLAADLSVDFSGSQAMTIGGYSLGQMAVAVKGDLSNIVVSASGSLNIDNSLNVSLSGTFTSQDGVPTTTMSGTGSGQLGGFNLGSVSATLMQSPTARGLSADVSVNVGPVSGSGHVSYLQSNGSTLFDASLNGSLNIPGFSVGVGIGFGNCGDPCSGYSGYHFDLSAHLCFSGWCWDHSWSVNTGGGFGFSLGHSDSFTTGTAKFVIVEAYIEGGYDANIGFSQNGVNANASGDVSVHYKVWPAGWHSFGISVSFSFNPFEVCGGGSIAGHHWSICL
ncbi:MAG: hypothetical protein ACO38K_00095 [Ilumatobacteraceae bacterium]